MVLIDDVIYIDSREKYRVVRFKEYISRHKKHKITKDSDYYRITTSNGEFFYFKDIQTTKLDVGDFMFNGMVVEFKTSRDLDKSIDSTRDSRLDNQIDDAIKALHNKTIHEYIIVSTLLTDLNFHLKKDRVFYEDIVNYTIQHTHDNISVINATSEDIAFRDIINYWRTGVSKRNRFTPNSCVEHNAFLHGLRLVPAWNHNQTNAIFRKYPFSTFEDLKKLDKEMLSKVKVGKKKMNTTVIEDGLEQLKIRIGK